MGRGNKRENTQDGEKPGATSYKVLVSKVRLMNFVLGEMGAIERI